MGDSLGDRMKRYEAVYNQKAVRRTPLVIRVDGKAFHTFTRGCEKPFDQHLINSMVHAAAKTAEKMQGFKVGYVQSDEATFVLTDYDDLKTSAWFDYKVQKICSIAAAYMSVYFNGYYFNGRLTTDNLAVFDARVFSVPKEEVANAILWRMQDWSRNSLQMMARAHFSHKELHGVNQVGMHEMLHKIGKNWATDCTDQQKNGTVLTCYGGDVQLRTDVRPSYIMINNILKETGVVND